jgi:type I restriction enzyme S subunit
MSSRPGYKITEVGEIPENWESVRLGEEHTATIIMGQSPPSSTYNDISEGLPFLQGNADFGETYPRPRIFASNPIKIAIENDILVSVRAPVGEVNLSRTKCCIGRGLSAIRVNPARFNVLFAFYYIRNAIKRLVALEAGSTFKAIRKMDLESFVVVIPSLPEQNKIASVLSAVDAAIQKTDEIIAKTQQLKKGLMQQLLTRGIGHTKFKRTEIGEIPKRWDVIRIHDLGEVITGSTPSTRNRDYYDNDYPLVTPFDLGQGKYVTSTQRRISRKGLDAVRSVPRDAVLVTCIGATIGKLGMASELCATNQQINSIVCNSQNDPHFVYYTLARMEQRLKLLAGQTALPILKKKDFSDVSVQRPPLPEQRKIASVLSEVDNKIAEESQSREELERLKKGLMQVLLTGTVRVKVT